MDLLPCLYMRGSTSWLLWWCTAGCWNDVLAGLLLAGPSCWVELMMEPCYLPDLCYWLKCVTGWAELVGRANDGTVLLSWFMLLTRIYSGWVECVTDWNMLLTVLGYWQCLEMCGMCYWLKRVLILLGYWQYLGMSWMCYWLYWVTGSIWGWLECVTDWNMLLILLGYWQYLGMNGMCYWLKCVTDFTGLLTVFGDDWNVTDWNMLLILLGYWQYLGMSGMCYWLLGYWKYLGVNAMCYWLKYFTDCTGLLTVLGDEWNVLLTIHGCWLHLGYYLERVTKWNILLTGLGYWLNGLTAWLLARPYYGQYVLCYWQEWVAD
jgi:hypothetical protein